MSRALFAIAVVCSASYHVQVLQPWGTFHPLYAGAEDLPALELVYDRLFFRSPSTGAWVSRVVADVVRSPSTTTEGPTLQIAIVPGIRWHDGAPLRAEDICFTVSTLIHPDNPPNPWRSHLAGCSVQNGLAHLEFSHGAPEERALASFYLLPAHHFAGPVIPPDHPIARSPVGTGPMRALRPDPQQTKLEFVRYDNPHHRPRMSRMTLHKPVGLNLPEPAYTLGVSDLPYPPAGPTTPETPVSSQRWTWIAITPDRAPWSDPRAREALDLLLDRPALFAGLGIPADTPPLTGPFLAGSGLLDPAVPPPRTDVARATQLFQQVGVVRGPAGWAYQGQPLHLTVGVDAALLRRFRNPPGNLAAALQQAGFAATPYLHRTGEPAAYDLYLSATVVGDYEFLDPLLHTPTATRGYTNPLRWSNPTTDALLDALQTAPDADAERAAAYALHRHVAEVRPLIPLFEDPLPAGYSDPHQPLAPVYGFTQLDAWTPR
jgi:ABC-type transport system substrate-binding protein